MKSKNQIIKWLFFTIFLLLTFFYFQPVLAVEPDLGLDEVASQTGLGGGDLRVMVGSIIKVSLGFLGVVALLLVLYGGYLYMTSGGQEEKIGKAKKVLISAIIGLALIFSAYAITAFVFKSLGIAINGGDDDSGGSGPVIISGGNGSLYVNSITPAGNVPIRNVKVKINFSKPVNSGTVTTENISIYKKSSSQKIVSFGEALSVSEANNNSSILASIINDDGVATQNWLVCGADFDGASPMDVELDNANKGDAEKTFLIIKGNKSTNASSADKTFSITCKASGSEQVYDIIDKQVLLDGENVFALPALCATSDRVIVTVIGTGNACLNLDYVALKYEKTQVEEQNILVEGNLEVNGFYRNLVTFVPSAFCGDDHPDLHCFDANSSYEVKIKEDAVRSITGDLAVNCSLGSNCIGNFSTGDLVDTASPVANFVQPAPNAKVSVDRLTDVVINGSDDSGISNIEFFVDEVSEGFSAVSSGLNQKDYIGNFSWDTEGLEFKRYQLKGIANDIDSNSGEKTISVSVLPARCFDSNGNILCDNDGSRPECGRCDGSSCNNDDDCAGICVKTCNGEGVLTCIDDTVCEEGTSCLGVCETVPIITDFAPKKAGVGALVTVAGSGFGNFVSNISKVYFSDGNGGYLPAQIGCNDNYNWSQSNVVVKVPSGAVTGPIKIVTGSQKVDTTDNDDGGILADFVVDNSVQFPSLCSVRTTDCTPACIGSICNKCDNGIINDNVLGAGENFGATKNDDAGMFFGSIPGLFVQGFNWTNTLVSNVGIPNIAKQRHDVFVSTGEICQSGDGQECTPPSADCECEVINSNPVPFYVVDGNNEPTIERLDPSVGPVGQYVTVYGKNFGADVGYVTIEREVDGVPFEWVMVTNCGDKAWTANQLVVKVPEKIKVQLSSSGEDFYLGNNYKIKVYNSAGIVSNSVDFEINNEVPTPGLCAIDPSAGPVGVKVDLIGENFGIQEGSFDLYFSQNGGTVLDCPSGITPCTPGENLCSCTWKNDQGTDVVEINSWTNELLSGVTVPAGTVSGGVFFRDDNGRTSNAVNFTVGSCSANSCSDGRNCCSDGACRINCQDEVEYLPSEYMWLVSTGPLPITPSVLERTCLTGYYPQSPSPAKDSEDACPNGLISATFNMLMGPNGNIPPYDSNTFQGNVVIKRCLSTGTKCNFTNCNETGVGGCLQKTVNAVALNDIGKTGLSYNCQKNGNPCDPNNTEGCSCNTSAEISTFALNSSITDSLNDLVGVTGNPNIFENVNNKIGLYKNSWYEVTIKGGDGGVGTGKLGATLPKDYSWQFKTKNQDCQPTDLLLTPLVGLISDLEDKEKYNIAGQYQCQTISLRNENWQWNFIQSTEKAQFAGYACLADEPMVCAEPTQRRNDVGVFEIKSNVDVTFDYETLPGQPLEISATAEPIDEDLAEIFEQMFKKGFLNINFSDPRVINFYPDCIEACINSEIGVNFNIRMSANSFVPNQSIKLFSCSSSACTALTPITLADDEVNFAHVDASAISESKNLLSLHLNNNLLPNKYYRLVVSDEVKSSSGVNLIGLNYLSGSVSGGDCGDGFDNDADSAVDFTGGYKRADSAGALTYICGCYVNEDEHFVGYSEIGTTCASNEVFACFRTDNPQSLLTEDGALTVIADENIYYEPDQQCQSSSGFEMGDEGIFDSFSFVFKTKNDSTPCAINSVLVEPYNYVSETMAEKIEYWTVPMSSPDSCSVGGQRLNPFEYDWQWNSSDDVVATISNNLILQNGSASCNEKCQNIGSNSYGSVCGNNRVEVGEECDDGNIIEADECTANCLVNLQNINICQNDTENGCCGNGKVETGEECDDQVETVSCSDKCQNKGTDLGYLCGNGITEPGEDNDFGVTLNNYFGLNGSCLYQGSIYKNDELAAQRICGNGVLEDGEECESICKTKGTGTVCVEGQDDCVCSLSNNPYCNDKCVWQGFPTCNGGCTREVSCYSGDPGCVGYKEIPCDSGADCIGERLIPCADGESGCTNNQKEISCIVGQTYNCVDGYRKEVCYAGEDDCSGEKHLDCAGCVNGKMIINCANGEANPDCVNGKQEVVCSDYCSNPNNMFVVPCQEGDSGCVDSKKQEVCSPDDEGCSCENCCGNGILEDYNIENSFGADFFGTKLVMEEECESTCLKNNQACNYGEAGCVCVMDEGCTNSCLNAGSSISYDSICGDGVWQHGEDKRCECLGESCTSLRKGAPYQVAETIADLGAYLDANIETQTSFVYDLSTKYIIGATNVSANTREDIGKIALTKLFYRTNDPALVEKYKDELPQVGEYFNPCEIDSDSLACEEFCLENLGDASCCQDDLTTAENECSNPCLIDSDSDACKQYCELYPDGNGCCVGAECIDDWDCSTTANINYSISSPVVGSINACPNALIRLYTVNSNIDATNVNVALLEESTVPCATVVSFWNKIKSSIKSLFVKSGLATGEIYYCPTTIEYTGTQFNSGSSSYHVFNITPMGLLKLNTKYKVSITGVKNECGEDINAVEYSFTVGGKMCRIEYLAVVPSDVMVNQAQIDTSFEVLPMSNNQAIVEIPGVYDWRYSWQAGDTSIVESIKTCTFDPDGACFDDEPQNPEGDSATVNVRNTAKNGSTYIEAKATILTDKSEGTYSGTDLGESTAGAVYSGTANLTVYLCDNVWNPIAPNENWQTMSTPLSSGSYLTTYLWEKNYNVGLFYCRDAGNQGDLSDDLPRLFLGSSVLDQLGTNSHNAIYFDSDSDWLKIDEETLNQYIDFNDSEQSWTIDSWVFLDSNRSLSGFRNIFYQSLDGGKSLQLGLSYLDDKKYKIAYRVGAEGKITSIFDYHQIKNGFNHLALVHDAGRGAGGQNILYLNGVEVTEMNNTDSLPNHNEDLDNGHDFYLGSRALDEDTSFLGYVDEFRIWNKTFSKEENNEWRYRYLDGSEDGLIGAWRFDSVASGGFMTINGLLPLQPHCEATGQGASPCEGGAGFQIIDLNDKSSLSLYEDFNFESSQEVEQQCVDGEDNDENGLVDLQDPKCVSVNDNFENPALLKQYFFVRQKSADYDTTNDAVADVISLRIYENPEYLTPEAWYRKYAPNPGNIGNSKPADCQMDESGQFCYRTAQDQTTLYVSATNVNDSVVYNNMYVLGFSSNSNSATQNIYNQMIDTLKFNLNILQAATIPKIKLVRDYNRYSDMVYLRNLIDEYKRENEGQAPTIDAGSYVRGETFSVWPSWQNELGKTLGNVIPVDPLNHFVYSVAGSSEMFTGQSCNAPDESGMACLAPTCKDENENSCVPDLGNPECLCVEEYQCVIPGRYCVKCPVGYDKETCYNSNLREFYELIYEEENLHPVYNYLNDPFANGNKGAYQLKFMKELTNINHRVVPELNNQ